MWLLFLVEIMFEGWREWLGGGGGGRNSRKWSEVCVCFSVVWALLFASGEIDWGGGGGEGAGEGEGVVMVALLSKDVKFSGLNFKQFCPPLPCFFFFLLLFLKSFFLKLL